MTAPDAKQIPHLFAGLIALALAAIVLFAAHRALIHLEHATIASTAPESFALKNQGLVFQRADAHSQTVLPIYVSSELLRPAAPERGNIPGSRRVAASSPNKNPRFRGDFRFIFL